MDKNCSDPYRWSNYKIGDKVEILVSHPNDPDQKYWFSGVVYDYIRMMTTLVFDSPDRCHYRLEGVKVLLDNKELFKEFTHQVVTSKRCIKIYE